MMVRLLNSKFFCDYRISRTDHTNHRIPESIDAGRVLHSDGLSLVVNVAVVKILKIFADKIVSSDLFVYALEL